MGTDLVRFATNRHKASIVLALLKVSDEIAWKLKERLGMPEAWQQLATLKHCKKIREALAKTRLPLRWPSVCSMVASVAAAPPKVTRPARIARWTRGGCQGPSEDLTREAETCSDHHSSTHPVGRAIEWGGSF